MNWVLIGGFIIRQRHNHFTPSSEPMRYCNHIRPSPGRDQQSRTTKDCSQRRPDENADVTYQEEPLVAGKFQSPVKRARHDSSLVATQPPAKIRSSREECKDLIDPEKNPPVRIGIQTSPLQFKGIKTAKIEPKSRIEIERHAPTRKK
jgi:hypothetical protein